MTKFISLHAPNGKELKIKGDVIFGLQEIEIEDHSGKKITCTLVLTTSAQVPAKESIEQIEAMMSEPDFTP